VQGTGSKGIGDRQNLLQDRMISPLRFDDVRCEDLRNASITLKCVDDPTLDAYCSFCRAKCPRYDHLCVHMIRHLDFEEHPVYLEFRFPRVKCTKHGVGMTHQLFYSRYGYFSLKFEEFVLGLVTDKLSATELSQTLGINRKSLARILERVYLRNRKS